MITESREHKEDKDMMKSEFIELTGFEPTGEEYKEIEAEYMACDIDKKDYCKQWLKNGGIQRLSRLRVAKIDELERELAETKKWADEMVETAEKRIALKDKKIEMLQDDAKILRDRISESDGKLYVAEKRIRNMKSAIEGIMNYDGQDA